MKEYHKIQTVFKRDPENSYKTLLDGEYALPEFRYLAENSWAFTEKVDGTNIRVMWDGEKVRFGGKTDRAQIPTFLLDRLQDLFSAGKLLSTFEETATCLYGEGFGAKIQKGGGNYISDGVDFVLFDVRIGGWWLQRDAVEGIADNLGVQCVPIIGFGTLEDMVDKVKVGFSSRWGDFTAEGIVARPVVELKTRSGHRIITKIKYKDFKHD